MRYLFVPRLYKLIVDELPLKGGTRLPISDAMLQPMEPDRDNSSVRFRNYKKRCEWLVLNPRLKSSFLQKKTNLLCLNEIEPT